MKRIVRGGLAAVFLFNMQTSGWAVTPSEEAQAKEVLKQALQGAVTGAVAAEAGASPDAVTPPPAQAVAAASPGVKKYKNKNFKKDRKGRRPPGWDRGRKTGWEGGDTPPGLRDKKSGA